MCVHSSTIVENQLNYQIHKKSAAGKVQEPDPPIDFRRVTHVTYSRNTRDSTFPHTLAKASNETIHSIVFYFVKCCHILIKIASFGFLNTPHRTFTFSKYF